MSLRTLHRCSAFIILAFACVHIANHLASLSSVESHIHFMEAVRLIYRQQVVEIFLLLCVSFQIFSGLWLVVRGWRERTGFVPWLQAISGAYIAFFLLVHVAAILFGRVVLKLDTNFYFAAAGFHMPPYQFFFAPYYFLAVLALFTHLGCALYWQRQSASRFVRTVVVTLPILVGGLVSIAIVLSLAGMIQPVDVPAKYLATYAR